MTRNTVPRRVVRWTALLLGSMPAWAALSARLDVAAPSPLSVGMPVHLSASATGGVGTVWYRFRARRTGEEYSIIRDFSPLSTLDWAAVDSEGTYQIEVAARNLDSGATSVATSLLQVQSLVAGGSPTVTPTANSLVFLYSAPPCTRGQQVKVIFQSAGIGPQGTPFKDCLGNASTNFYLAGLRPNTTYTANQILNTGGQFIQGPDVTFTTGDVPSNLYKQTNLISRVGLVSPILLGSPLLGLAPVAYDQSGAVVWYGPTGLSSLTRAEHGGEFWGFIEDATGPTHQILRKFDLTGMTLLETNAARVNEQLAALGKRQITTFHHDVRTISGGRIAALASVEQILSDVQGPGPVDIIGDMIIVMDDQLNVVWTWDAFENLDVHRAAILGETCSSGPGCPPLRLATNANDWLHGNSIQETPDGHLLYSTRHQDWVVKISYDSGYGDGHVIWKLGKDGDFSFVSNDSFPWFSHQHDANFGALDPSLLLVFDDGNTRVAQFGGGNSRGQVFQVDEVNRTVTPVLSADLGVYSLALGSAQALSDGSYHFDAGYVQEGANPADSYSFQMDSNGNLLYKANTAALLYRSFRLADMYTPE